MSQWVQHISGQGEKWEVVHTGMKSTEWAVNDKRGIGKHYLPTSEYILCDPPEEWEVCTGDMIKIIHEQSRLLRYSNNRQFGYLDHDERWAWSEKDPEALVIQRKVKS